MDSNLYSMITVSDNDAANTLTSYLGSGDGNAGMSVVKNTVWLTDTMTPTWEGFFCTAMNLTIITLLLWTAETS